MNSEVSVSSDRALALQPEAVDAVWRCFHCDEAFADAGSAREHFGSSERQQPACLIDIAEYRAMEEVNRRHCEEDTDLHRALHAKDSELQQAVMRSEEQGYARGLRDARKAIEFAEYMAKGAERLLAAIANEDRQRLRLEGDSETQEEQEIRVYEEAFGISAECRCECARGLREDVYEFRKRAGLPEPSSAASGNDNGGSVK